MEVEDESGSGEEMDTLEGQHRGQHGEQEDACLHPASQLHEPQREDLKAEQKDEPPATHIHTNTERRQEDRRQRH